ncbi:Arginyl-tRNA synthetase [Hordeum vulgare]|nr:Arginyl-tRNA synthetase [Hordeum vulgare]
MAATAFSPDPVLATATATANPDPTMVVAASPPLGMTGQVVGLCGGTGDGGSWDHVTGFVAGFGTGYESGRHSCRCKPSRRRTMAAFYAVTLMKALSCNYCRSTRAAPGETLGSGFPDRMMAALRCRSSLGSIVCGAALEDRGRRWSVFVLHGVFGGDVRSCLADRCYTLSCMFGRCYARQTLRVFAYGWMSAGRSIHSCCSRGNPRIWFSRSDDGGIAVSFLSREHRLWRSTGRQRQEVERLCPARSFDGDVRSCLANRCYALACLFGRCYARQILQSLRVWIDERREVAPLGAVVASMDGRTGMDDADFSSEDGQRFNDDGGF